MKAGITTKADPLTKYDGCLPVCWHFLKIQVCKLTPLMAPVQEITSISPKWSREQPAVIPVVSRTLHICDYYYEICDCFRAAGQESRMKRAYSCNMCYCV